jgi:peptidoglycan/LPS O-acetylase OafA/YrhL
MTRASTTASTGVTRAVRPGKVQYLEGLRGIAAAQVVLFHFVAAFLPYTAEHAAPPFHILWDGHTAVYVFFLISGVVLTPSFARGGAWPRQTAKRLVRLGIPVAAAAVVALILIAIMPDAHRAAARITGSSWLAMDSNAATTPAHLLREVTLDSLILGFREYTLFTPIAGRLPLLEHALNAPTWSLHLELYGSLLLLGLVMLRARSRWEHTAAVVACAILFGTHPMFLFVLGHLFASRLGKPPKAVTGLALIALGLAMSASKDWILVDDARIVLGYVTLTAVPNLYQFQSQLAAVVLFAGVLRSPITQRLLSRCQALGRLSFSIYLLHFPILFTLACAAFIPLADVLPRPAAVAITFAGFVALVLLAAVGFERFVDRRAVALGQIIDRRGRTPMRSKTPSRSGGS